MTVVVAHLAQDPARAALSEAVRECERRAAPLVVVHVTSSALDADRAEAFRAGVADDLRRAGAGEDLDWTLRLAVEDQDVAGAILGVADSCGAQVVVVGARRRSPVGKALLGSVTQSVVLAAEVPVLVVTV